MATLHEGVPLQLVISGDMQRHGTQAITIRLQAIANGLEIIAIELEAIAIGLQAIALEAIAPVLLSRWVRL